jgi:hypothetical protein
VGRNRIDFKVMELSLFFFDERVFMQSILEASMRRVVIFQDWPGPSSWEFRTRLSGVYISRTDGSFWTAYAIFRAESWGEFLPQSKSWKNG